MFVAESKYIDATIPAKVRTSWLVSNREDRTGALHAALRARSTAWDMLSTGVAADIVQWAGRLT